MKLRALRLALSGTCLLLLACGGGASGSPQTPVTPDPGSPSIAFTVTDLSVKGGNNGAIQTTISGGTSPYTYAWSSGSTSKDLANLGSGVYTLTVTDARGHSVSKKSAIIDPSQAKDMDANIYETILIGTQTWLASNVRCTQTSVGEPIAAGTNVLGGSTAARYYTYTQAGSAVNEANPVLYNWPGAQAACLAGWHIPTEQEWETLQSYLAVEGQGGTGTDVAAKLLGSASPSGFDALFTGNWDAGTFFDHGSYAAFWSATQWPSDNRDMWYFQVGPGCWSKAPLDKRCAFTIRLIKN